MLDHLNIEKIFFIDIETVPQFPRYQDMPEDTRIMWDRKAEQIRTGEPAKSPGELYPRAGIYAEFGKIICISVGIIKRMEDGNLQFRLKSFPGDNETELLEGFIRMLREHFKPGINYLCAHNGREFDFPYIARRILINGLALPPALDIAGKKPWENEYLLDTMQLWRFGDIKNYTSLELLCHVFRIPTPKDEISGKDVWFYYWEKKKLQTISEYCEKDVLAIARLILRFTGSELIRDENVVHITD